mmetsp:Transcript_7749/g.34436  ORF Transcript_7749/g.34436 Transcript_7749/m.34436 type:complete len:102 (-) Transcript_7749:3854-4159(-)
MYFASDESVKKVNNALVAGLVALFGGLLVTVLPQAVPENLLHQDIPQAISAIPVLVLSLVFHNIVPSVVSQLDGKEYVACERFSRRCYDRSTRLPLMALNV